MRIRRIDHLAIAVPDLEEALEFYRDTLGLEVSHVDTERGQGVRVAFMPVGRCASEGETAGRAGSEGEIGGGAGSEGEKSGGAGCEGETAGGAGCECGCSGEIELIEPMEPDSGVARFLDNRGAGMHHLCLEVDDLDAALERLKAADVELIDDEPYVNRLGRRLVFIHPRSAFGVLIELCELPAGDRGRDEPTGQTPER